MVSELRADGVSVAATYDGYGRLTGYERSNAGAQSYLYNGLDDRVAMTRPTVGTRHFVYDASGRVMGGVADVQRTIRRLGKRGLRRVHLGAAPVF